MLKGTQILLRASQPGDAPALEMLRNDLALQLQLMAQPRPNRAEEVSLWLQRRQQESDTAFFVIAQADGSCCGFIQLTQIQTQHRHARLGLGLLPSYRGRGYAQEAHQLLENYARQAFNLGKISLEVRADNISAHQLYLRLGYQEVGRLKQHFYSAGQAHDVLVMELYLT